MPNNENGVYANDDDTIKHLTDVMNKPDDFEEEPSKFPIGTILPVFPPKGAGFKMPKGWVVCDGRVVVHPHSPFKNTNLPNLTSDIFLMGTGVDKVGSESGNNTMPSDGAHNHSGSTGGPSGHDRCDNGGDRHPGSRNHGHSFTTSTNGGHDHGGDNRPHFFGVLYIIRIF